MGFMSGWIPAPITNKKTIITKEVLEDAIDKLKEIAEEEWVWIEGYKGTDKNIRCRDYQFNLGEKHVHEGEVELCGSGFHFCTKLEHVFSYYNIRFGHRFFKVKALVKKNYFSEGSFAENDYVYGYGMIKDSKVTAKEIILTEELTYDDLKERIKQYLPMIEDSHEYYKYLQYGDYDTFCYKKFTHKMVNYGFGELYANVVKEDLDIDNIAKYLTRAEAYYKEGISKDMMVYLLEKYLDKLNRR